MKTNPLGNGNKRTIGIGDLIVSNDPADVIVTYSLGSCIGVTMWDPVARVGGMVHCLLPRSKSSNAVSEEHPARFVDRGIPTLLRAVFDAGAIRENLRIKVAGAANPLEGCDSFRIGARNYSTLKKLLWRNDLLITAERIGGTKPRTLTLHIADGRTFVHSQGTDEEI